MKKIRQRDKKNINKGISIGFGPKQEDNIFFDIFNMSPMPSIVSTVKEGRIMLVNEAFVKLTGYDMDEIIGKTSNDLRLWLDKRQRKKAVDILLRKSGVFDFEACFRHSSGSVHDCLFFAKLVNFEGKPYICSIIFDITEKKRFIEEISKSEFRFRQLFMNMSSGVAIYEATGGGRDFIIKDINPAAERIDNIKRKNIIENSVLKVFPGVKKMGLFDVLKSVYKTGRPRLLPVVKYEDKRISGWRQNYVYKLPSGEIVAVYDDFTEQKNTEHRTGLFKELLNRLSEALYVIDPATTQLLDVNERACKYTGYKRGELLKVGIGKIQAEKFDMKAWKSLVQKTRKKGYVVLHTFHKRKDGSVFPVEASLCFVDYGDRDYIIAIVRDITERKNAEEALLQSELKYRLIFESSRDAIMTLIPYKSFLDGNIATFELFGCKNKAEFCRQTPSSLSPEFQPDGSRSDEKAQVMMKIAMEQGSNFFEWTHKRLNGSKFFATVLLTRFELDGQKMLQATVRDITERKKAQEKIKRSEEEVTLKHKQLLSIFDSIDEVVFISDPITHEILYFNEAFKRVFKGAPGGKCHLFVQGRDKPCLDCPNKYIFGENLGKVFNWERKNNINGRWYRCIGKAIRWPDGRMVRYEMAIDITNLKKAQEEKARLEHQLLQAQKLESIGTMASGLAHSLNNILGAIRGYAGMAQKQLAADSIAYYDIDHIKKGTEDAKQLVDKMLIFSRRHENKFSPVSVQNVVNEALDLFKASLVSRIEISEDIDKNCSPVLADSNQLQQVVLNLCTNASHALHKKENGIIKISLHEVEAGPELVRKCSNLKEGRYINLKVSDNGCGMDKDTIARIFEPFFTQRETGTGTGLGLSVVHGIIFSHKGGIIVESAPGKGSTFDIYLPVSVQA